MYQDNVFTKIIRGEAPCGKVAESEHSLAFNDMHPQARVHVLVIPKGRYENIADFIAGAPADQQADFWNLVRRAADAAGVLDNFRMQANTGVKAGQSVPHFHVHIMSD